MDKFPKTTVEMMNASEARVFCHKPKRGEMDDFIHPHVNAETWNKAWAAAKAQPWYTGEEGLVGGNKEKGEYYFQRWGVTSGFAKVVIQ